MRQFFVLSVFCFACSNPVPEDVADQDSDLLETESDTGNSPSEPDDNRDPAESFDDIDGDGWTSDMDCDDMDERIHPGAPEYCDGIDTDCDGVADPNNAIDAELWFRDQDHDGFGHPDDVVQACEHPGIPFVANGDDCDDGLADINPDAPEFCDGIDNNCDGVLDSIDSVDARVWYQDRDGDGFGDPADNRTACEAPTPLWVDAGGDCDDTDDNRFPGAEEFCDGFDSDCDGLESLRIATFETSGGERRNVTSNMESGYFRATEFGTLRVCEGTWNSMIAVDVDAGLSLVDEAVFVMEGVGDVFIDVEGAGRVVTVVGGPSRIELRNVELMRGEATKGGAIYADTADVILEDVYIEANTASQAGGAVYLESGNLTAIDSGWVDNSVSGFGVVGGAVFLGEGDFVGSELFMRNNSATGWGFGGAIFLTEGNLFLEESVIEDNEASFQGGAAVLRNGSAELVDTVVKENASFDGGGVYITGELHMYGSVFDGNQARGTGGGVYMTGDDEDSGVFCDADGVDGAGFVNNESDSEGGALWVDSTDSRLQIQSSSCDWGTGGSDNRDFDIGMPHHRVIADGEVTFVCNGTVCSSTVESYGVIFVEEITLF